MTLLHLSWHEAPKATGEGSTSSQRATSCDLWCITESRQAASVHCTVCIHRDVQESTLPFYYHTILYNTVLPIISASLWYTYIMKYMWPISCVSDRGNERMRWNSIERQTQDIYSERKTWNLWFYIKSHIPEYMYTYICTIYIDRYVAVYKPM